MRASNSAITWSVKSVSPQVPFHAALRKHASIIADFGLRIADWENKYLSYLSTDSGSRRLFRAPSSAFHASPIRNPKIHNPQCPVPNHGNAVPAAFLLLGNPRA